MSTPDNLRLAVPHPIPTADHAALLSSFYLLGEQADDCLPVRVRPTSPTSFFESWEITRAAFIARMAGAVRHLRYLAPSYSRLDGVALARTLVDHVITFAWISAAPAERLPALLRTSFKSLLAKHNRAVERGGSLLEDAPRPAPPLDRRLRVRRGTRGVQPRLWPAASRTLAADSGTHRHTAPTGA